MSNILTRFASFHKANPGLWRDFVRTAEELHQIGERNHSARNWIRFSSQRRYIQKQGEVYRVNNDFTPIYTRLLEFIRPDLVGVFEKRESTYDHLTPLEWQEITGLIPGKQMELFG